MIAAPAPTPVIPTFGGSDSCVANANALFCPSWVSGNWNSILLPELLQHIELTVIAVVIGLVISFGAALIAFRNGWFARGFSAFGSILYTIPSLAFFEMFTPVTGIGMLTIEIGLVGYTLLILFRNILEGLRAAPAEALTAATGIGMTPRQVFWKVNVRLAVPAIFAGLRVATVTTVSLATVAAYISTIGLGAGIQRAIQNSFNTELLATGVLTILLALVADALIVAVQRVLTPWQRAARRA